MKPQFYPLLALLFLFTQVSFGANSPKTVTIKNASDEIIGTAVITPFKKGVRIRVEAQKLPEGELGFHIHEKGSCVKPDFKSAGNHLSFGKQSHGLDSHHGPHAGDLPNLIVGSDGVARAEFIKEDLALNSKSLLRAGGTAIVIHSGPDDYKSQPSGNSGDRFACGEIR